MYPYKWKRNKSLIYDTIGISAYKVKLLISGIKEANNKWNSWKIESPPPRHVILVGMSLLLMDLFIIADCREHFNTWNKTREIL